jgi:hypothetical protein
MTGGVNKGVREVEAAVRRISRCHARTWRIAVICAEKLDAVGLEAIVKCPDVSEGVAPSRVEVAESAIWGVVCVVSVA